MFKLLNQLLQTIILGLIQGFAEWLPISSTAHLKIAEHFLGTQATPLFNVTLHLGTLVVVVYYFRRDVKGILLSLAHLEFRSEYGQFIPLIFVATIPTGVIGLLYVRYLESSFQTLLIIGVTFLIGASIVYASKRGREDSDKISYGMALLIGAAQGFAIFPGLSRSGVTISSSLLLGVKRQTAFRFAFLLSIPAVIGDLIVEAYQQRGELIVQGVSDYNILVSLLVTMVAGYLAIVFVNRLVLSRRFHYFAIYAWLLGSILIILSLYGF